MGSYHVVDLIDHGGWDYARCDCGWESPPCPDTSTAAGFYGDHRSAVIAQRFEPFGLIWRPKAGSRRWQHRMHLDGRAYPSAAEFVDVYRRVGD